MKTYETTCIVDGSLNEEDREAVIKRFEDVLTKLTGEIDSIVRWGLRQLAYEINKRTRGYYVIFYYNANPSIINTFHHELDINEHILRYLTLHSDGKKPEYIRDEGEPILTSPVSDTLQEMTESFDEAEEKPVVINEGEPEDDDPRPETESGEEKKGNNESRITIDEADDKDKEVQ